MRLNSSALNTATQEEGVDFVINTYFSCSKVFGPSPASQPCFLWCFVFCFFNMDHFLKSLLNLLQYYFRFMVWFFGQKAYGS